MKKKALTIILTLVMCLGLLAVPVFALDAVSNVEYSWNDSTSTLSSEPKSEADYTEVTAETTTWNDSWYVVTGDVTIDSRVTVNGMVNLILADGCTLNTKGITVTEDNSLTVYGQLNGTGVLNASADKYRESGIGGAQGQNCGAVTIHGGIVNAVGRSSGAGIGGGGGGLSSYGGNSSRYTGGSGADVKVNGGVVFALSADDSGVAIGAGIKTCAVIMCTVPGTSATVSCLKTTKVISMPVVQVIPSMRALPSPPERR